MSSVWIFIVELPARMGRCSHDVVDSVERAHFIPTNTTITALGAARLFLHNSGIARTSHAASSPIGPVVASSPESCTGCLVSPCQRHGLSPTTDGQTERVNQELETVFRVFVKSGQDDWDELLPMASSSTITTSTPALNRPVPTRLRSAPAHGFEPTRHRLIWKQSTSLQIGCTPH